MKKIIPFIVGLFSLVKGFAQDKTPSSGEYSWATKDSLLGFPIEIGIAIVLILFFIFLILIGIVFITISFGRATYLEEKKLRGEVTGLVKIFGVFEGDYSYMTSEYRDEVIHEYDGIEEYDNDLPPWWKVGFYLTIIFAVSYFVAFHGADFSFAKLQAEEYVEEVEEAKVKYANVDQVYDAPTEDVALLENSKAVFMKSCKACHGASGEGGVGPNLTDKYWLHGGGVNEIYKTVKYGVVEKGMKAWKSDYSNNDIYGLSSYILSLQGSNPSNPKEPQGDLVEE